MIRWTCKEFICTEEGCGRTFNTRWTLKRHSATHQRQLKTGFNCSQCDKYFSRKDSLERHLQLCHSNSLLLYICPEEGCGKIFNLKSTLSRHKHSHTDCYKCDECDSTFTRKDNLARHKASHSKKPKANCEVIDKISSDPNHSTQDSTNSKDMVLQDCILERDDHTYALLVG